jgi:hypothetical protein
MGAKPPWTIQLKRFPMLSMVKQLIDNKDIDCPMVAFMDYVHIADILVVKYSHKRVHSMNDGLLEMIEATKLPQRHKKARFCRTFRYIDPG